MAGTKNILFGEEPYEPIPNLSLGQMILDSLLVNSNDEHPALVDGYTEEEISYSTILKFSCSLAECLKIYGCEKNDIVGVVSENIVEYCIPVIASLYLGVITTTLNPLYTEYEFRHSLTLTKPKIIFCSKAALPKFLVLSKGLDFVEKIIVINSDTSYPNAVCLKEFINQTLGGTFLTEFSPAKLDPVSQVAFILYSSGTTGLPKGVMITHKNVIVHYSCIRDPKLYDITSKDTVFLALPFFHTYALSASLFSLLNNEKVLFLNKFDEHLFLELIEKYKVTRLPTVPPIMVKLAHSKMVENYDLSSIRDIICAAAPLGKDIEDIVLKRLGIHQVRQGYGLTEATFIQTLTPLNVRKSGSSGKPIPATQLAIRDPKTGDFLPAHQNGEIVMKGPTIMKGYFNNEKATRESFTSDGWLLTGDIGYYDENQWIYVVDRLKEIIKYKGYQVAPAEIEALLITHSKIKDAAVIGREDPDAGEVPLAFIVKEDFCDLTEKEVQKFVAENLSHYKQLRGGVKFVNSVPKSPSGKILRRLLRDELKQNQKITEKA